MDWEDKHFSWPVLGEGENSHPILRTGTELHATFWEGIEPLSPLPEFVLELRYVAPFRKYVVPEYKFRPYFAFLPPGKIRGGMGEMSEFLEFGLGLYL